MELFLPNLLIVALAGILIFIFIPRFSSNILFLLCFIFFGFAVYSHYLMFNNTYQRAHMLETVKSYGSTVLIIVVVLAIFIATSNLFTNIKFKLPKWVQMEPSDQKVFSNVRGYSNIPIERLAELERQL